MAIPKRSHQFQPAFVTLLPLMVALAVACDPLISSSPPDARPEAHTLALLEFEPPRPADDVAPSSWLVVRNGSEIASQREPRLFRGHLSAYDQGRLARNDLPSTLLEREVPLHAWHVGEDLFAAPAVMLELGIEYTLAWSDSVLIGSFLVADAPDAPLLERLWPPLDAPGGVHQLFCATEAIDVNPESFSSSEYGVELSILSGAEEWGMPECLEVRAKALPPGGQQLALPPEVQGFALPPTFLVGVESEPSPVALCPEDELAVLGACLLVQDDRIRIENHGSAAFWQLKAASRSWHQVLSESAVRTFVGFSPNQRTELDVRVLRPDLDAAFRLEVTTSAAVPHVVINEVMANPVGPEPAQEWVELVNDGTETVELEGFRLEDAGDGADLPAHSLAPGEIVILTTEDYEPDAELDAVPLEQVPLLRLPLLGKSGLLNSGELIRLRGPDGSVVSKFPATPKPKEGRSVARRFPHTAFQESGDFGIHAAPGSSPGAPNDLEPMP